MTVKEKIQRAAAAAVLSRMIKYVRKDPDTNLVKLIDKSELFVGNIFPSKNFDSFREGAKDPDNIWRQLGLRLLNETDDNVIMNMALALGLGAAVNGTKAVRTNREKYAILSALTCKPLRGRPRTRRGDPLRETPLPAGERFGRSMK